MNQTNILNSKANQFFIYIDKQLIPWDIHSPNQDNRGFVVYFSQVLQAVDKILSNQNLTFYVTSTEMKELPSYGKNIFVLIFGDEHYRIPIYVDKVGGIFKCYGIHQIRDQINLYSSLSISFNVKILVISQMIYNLVLRLPGEVNYRLKKILFWSGQDRLAPIYDIPPGYYNSENLPIKPIADRPYDVSFDGSIANRSYPIWSLKYWSKTTKSYLREQMVMNLKKFEDNNPQFQTYLATTDGFAQTNNTDENSYRQNMMNTKICLVPKGTTFETYRLFEAMRYGCVIVSQILPPRWFYDGSPIIQIGSWQNLEVVLQRLLEDPLLLQSLHQQTLEWWQTKCSEQAVGQYIANQITNLTYGSSQNT